MSRLPTEFTPGDKSSKLLDNNQEKFGKVPNIYKLMSHSSNVLEAYLYFSSALIKGSLSERDRQQIALIVSGYDRSQYCASADTLLAKQVGVSDEETRNTLKGTSENPRTMSLINFCLSILENNGFVSDQNMVEIREAGFTDEEIVEIVAAVCIKIFTNYFNHVAESEVDFPLVSLD